MDLEAIRNNAKEFAINAVKFDKLEEYKQAYDFYVKAANQLLLLIKYDKNPYSAKVYRDRAKDYVLRAKDIYEKKLKFVNEKLSKFNDSNININDDTTVKMRQLLEQNKKLQKEIYNMFAINFMSTAQNINCPMVCKKTDNFKVLEEKLYLDYPELRNKNLVFMANGSVINRYETLENNGIKPGNAIVIYENE